MAGLWHTERDYHTGRSAFTSETPPNLLRCPHCYVWCHELHFPASKIQEIVLKFPQSVILILTFYSTEFTDEIWPEIVTMSNHNASFSLLHHVHWQVNVKKVFLLTSIDFWQLQGSWKHSWLLMPLNLHRWWDDFSPFIFSPSYLHFCYKTWLQ